MDLDLSTLNGIIQSSTSGTRKTLNVPKRVTARRSLPQGDQDGEAAQGREQVDDWDEPTPEPSATPDQNGRNDGGDDESDAEVSGRENVQILDFHTHNPIVSYQGHLYSCTWTDMIGTNMFFTRHRQPASLSPWRSTKDCNLLGTSRIKLVGRRAKTIRKPQSKKRSREEDNDDHVDEVNEQPQALGENAGEISRSPEGRSLGGFVRSNPKTNIEIKKQARFLEQLMDVKEKLGETDNVRTVVNHHMAAVDARLHATREPEFLTKVAELNRKVVKGDAEALAQLQDMYSQRQDASNEPETAPDTAPESPSEPSSRSDAPQVQTAAQIAK